MGVIARYSIFWGCPNLTIPLLLGTESFLLFFIIINNFIAIKIDLIIMNNTALNSLVRFPVRLELQGQRTWTLSSEACTWEPVSPGQD